MRIRLLGYLAYVMGEEVLEVEGIRSVEEAIKRVADMKDTGGIIFSGNGLWEGMLIILNGEVVEDFKKQVHEGDELIITLPTAGG
ncbi:MoaD/ThiS family protein [Hydrogenobacter thermophilus]|uniref:MoaD/ThiS family protein n=1 Tax=Hydrogenobacter thermophilus TaxID=940 RepID=UPI0030F84A37